MSCGWNQLLSSIVMREGCDIVQTHTDYACGLCVLTYVLTDLCGVLICVYLLILWFNLWCRWCRQVLALTELVYIFVSACLVVITPRAHAQQGVKRSPVVSVYIYICPYICLSCNSAR